MKKLAFWIQWLTCLGMLTLSSHSHAAISQSPLFYAAPAPPLVMLTMDRSHKLYYEAYNDASDLNSDGKLDTHYDPSIEYFGYFDSYKCYTYGNNKFTPVSKTNTKKCTNQWSGDFLNYLTMSRMDALRKVLYGGYRNEDTATNTVLQRVYIPQDSHSWGKEYNSEAIDGYKISDYTPLAQPAANTRHLFASTTLSGAVGNAIINPPLLRVLQSKTNRIWDWVTKAGAQADNTLGVPTDYQVRVDVCINSLLKEKNCQPYISNNATVLKPVGLLQQYGEPGLIEFGLLTGSYQKHFSGGVLRKNIGPIKNEINSTTGQLLAGGIMDTINRMRIHTYNYTKSGSYDHDYSDQSAVATSEGWVPEWGNPIAEMLSEGMRYFAGKAAPNPDFVYSGVVQNNPQITPSDALLGLPKPNWVDPYSNTGGQYLSCSKPMQLVISDVNSSYDTDQLQGSSFNTAYTQSNIGTMGSGGLSDYLDTIWGVEYGSTLNLFIGESGLINDGLPTAKSANSFKNIRGIVPEEPGKKGGYYLGGIAWYGRQTDLNAVSGNQKAQTLSVALASPLPRMELPVNGKTIALVPFAKSVGGCFVTPGADANVYKPTDAIVDFYVLNQANTTPANQNLLINGGRPFIEYLVSFEDQEQGSDNELDALQRYTLAVNANNTLSVTVTSETAAGCIIQHLGYVISGTTADGTYLEVRDADTGAGTDTNYYLDTPNDNADLPLTHTRIFTPGNNTTAAFVNHDPLWYAAKWGSTDLDNDGVLDLDEWDSDNNNTPDNYFLVTNAGNLEAQLSKAFSQLTSVPGSGSAVAANVSRIDTQTLIYQAILIAKDWSGNVLALNTSTNGTIDTAHPAWKASERIPELATRKNNIFTFNPTNTAGSQGVLFDWNNLNTSQKTALNTLQGTNDGKGQQRLAWLQGDPALEVRNGGNFRNRTNLIGDIVNSSPVYVAKYNFGYSILSSPMGGAYTTFLGNNTNRLPMLYAGANDGMLHGFNASANGGNEKFAFIPSAVYPNLSHLTSPLYSHQYYVNGRSTIGDVYLDLYNTGTTWRTLLVGTTGAGGKSLFGIDVTDPNNFSAQSVLWEKTDADTDMADLGYTLPQTSIGLVGSSNNYWSVIVGNGYSSANGKAVLYILNAKTGAVIRSIDTSPYDQTDTPAAPNGLSSPLAVDSNADAHIDTIYAGDLHGNLWKFDVSDADPANWKIANNNQPFFVACTSNGGSCSIANRQPITAKPAIGSLTNAPSSSKMIYFGTGKYFEVGDNLVDQNHVPQKQTFYGLIDDGTVINNRSQLKDQSITFQGTLSNADGNSLADGALVRGLSSGKVCRSVNDSCTSVQKGWTLDLMAPGLSTSEGERVTGAATVRYGLVIFVSFIPNSNPCNSGGTSWPFFIDAANGGTPSFAPIDVTGDGKVDKNDLGLVGGSTPSSTEIKVTSFAINGITDELIVVDKSSEGVAIAATSSGEVIPIPVVPPSKPPLKSWRQLR